MFYLARGEFRHRDRLALVRNVLAQITSGHTPLSRFAFCLIIICGIALNFGIGVRQGFAQGTSDPSLAPMAADGQPSARNGKDAASSKSGKPESGKSEAGELASDIVKLKNIRGETLLLSKTVWDEVLNAITARTNQQQPEPPQWNIAGISLDGVTDGEAVTLKATVKILLLADGRWIKVPLRFNEGILQDQAYSGPGEATSVTGIDPVQGYQWWLKGKGLHQLTLTLSVPLRKEQPSRRLQLSLPGTVVSDLKLRIPMPRVTARISEQSRARLVVTPLMDGATQIDMLGLGPELDLRWQPQPELGSVATVLQAQTAIFAVVDGRTVSLDVTQKVVALQGSFNQLQIRLPTGSELLQLRGDAYKEHAADPTDPGLIQVTLKESATDTSIPVELKWKVRLESAQPDQVLLQGFDVAKAKLQTGYVALKVVGDYRLEASEDVSHFVHRANLSSLEESQPSFSSLDEVSSAFGFTRQPFQLGLQLRPEKPLITIKPRLFLSFSNNRMELFGEYDLQFYRGRIDDVKFSWQGWKEEGWKIDPVTAGGIVQDTALDDPAAVTVKLGVRDAPSTPRPTDRPGSSGKSFTMVLHASRPLVAGMANQEFSLPGLPDANVQTADFVLLLAENLDADLRPSAETAARLQSAPPVESLVIPKSMANLSRRRYFRLDAPRPKFSVIATVQNQRVSTSTDVEFSLEGSELKMTQRMSYDVAYERVSQVLLWVPEIWLDRAKFMISTEGKESKRIFTGAPAEGNRKQVLLVLESPQIGKFDVVVSSSIDFSLPPGTATKTVDMPLVKAVDTEFTSTRLRIQKPKRQRLNVTGEGWTPQSPQGGASVWIASTRQSMVMLQCDQSDASWQSGVAVPKRLVSVVFSPKGDVYCQVQYRFAGYVPVIRVSFPPGSAKINARWMPVLSLARDVGSLDETNAAAGAAVPGYQDLQLVETPGVSGQFEAALPETIAESEHLVALTYQLPSQPPLGSGAFRHLEIPEMLTDGTPTQTFWQIQLPENQHLWTLPKGFIPEFDWKLRSGWWSRIQRHSQQALRRWIGESTDPRQGTVLPVSGTRYVFSSLDSSSSMSFRTLSSPLILLIGASLALVFGFMLVNIPMFRHVLTFLWLGFLTTLAALWYSEPVLVLLQPACLGLVLALLATLAQRRRNKNRGIEPIVTLGAPSDILAATASHHEQHHGDSNAPPEPSDTRPPAIGLPEPGVGI